MCTNTEIKTNYVQVIGPDINFGANQTVTCPNTTVNFTDSTIFGAPITGWVWNFGDGTPTSNLQNPSHIYTSSGLYNVSLFVTDIDGCGRTFTRNNYIEIDTISPAITCPGNQTETLNSNCQFILSDYTALATTTDNCTVSPAVTQSPISGTIISGTTTITLTVNDGNGNSAQCTFECNVK